MAKNRFGIGFLIGAAAGGLAALFFTPNTGKENQKIAKEKADELIKMLKDNDIDTKLKKLVGQLNDEGMRAYDHVRPIVLEKLQYIRESLNGVNREKIEAAVQDALEVAKEKLPELNKELEKLHLGFKKFIDEQFAHCENCKEGSKVKTVKKINKQEE